MRRKVGRGCSVWRCGSEREVSTYGRVGEVGKETYSSWTGFQEKFGLVEPGLGVFEIDHWD